MEIIYNRNSTSHLIEDNFKDLPELEGSEKQVKWANDIRRKYLSEAHMILCENYLFNINPNAEGAEEFADYVKANLYKMASETSAKQWINRRNDSGYQMAAELLGKYAG